MKKDLIITKQRELIHQMGLCSMELDMPEILSEEHLDRINKTKMAIRHIESELSALESEPEEELFVKVYIRDFNDLPTESGKYGCVFKDNHFGEAHYDTKQRLASESDIWWINKVKWYLKPLTAKQ